jgi:hypothetical protein
LIKKCENCNKEFVDNTSNKNKICCSKKCTNRLWYLKNKHKRVIKKSYYKPVLKCYCKQCNKQLSRKTKYLLCNKCYIKYKYNKDFEHLKKYHKEYAKKNRKKINKRHRDRYNSDTDYKIANTLRKRLSIALKRFTKSNKKVSAVKDLGCTIEEFVIYIESKFYTRKDGTNMDWNNWTVDGWHIDHIKPLSKFDLSDPNEIKKACHYTNLQPLWQEDNLSKGDKYE